MLPGLVLTSELALYCPDFKPVATVIGFITEPGSNTSIKAWLRWFSLDKLFKSLALNDGQLDIAITSPELTSTIIPAAQRACCTRPTFSSSWYKIYCSRESTVNCKSLPATSGLTCSISLMLLFLASRMTMTSPSLPDSMSLNTRSTPACP